MLNLAESYEHMLSTVMLISCWLLCAPLVWEKTWVKDVLSDIINNTTDLVAVIEGFVYYKGEEQAIDRFVDERNHDWDIFFWSNSHLCGMFLEKFVWNKDEEKWMLYHCVSYGCLVSYLLWILVHVGYQHPLHENPYRNICQVSAWTMSIILSLKNQ